MPYAYLQSSITFPSPAPLMANLYLNLIIMKNKMTPKDRDTENLQKMLDMLERIYKGDIETKTVVLDKKGNVKYTRIESDPGLALKAIKNHQALQEELDKRNIAYAQVVEEAVFRR